MKTILQGLAIIFTLIASFLGNLYFLNGDIIISAFISSIIVVVLYFLQETFIKKKATISKNKLSSTSIILWTLYLLLSIPITFALIHALNVELNEKKSIQEIKKHKLSRCKVFTFVADKTRGFLTNNNLCAILILEVVVIYTIDCRH